MKEQPTPEELAEQIIQMDLEHFIEGKNPYGRVLELIQTATEPLQREIEDWKAKAKGLHFGLGCVSGLAQERYMKSHNGESDPFFMEFQHHLNSEWEEWQKAKATITQLQSNNALLAEALTSIINDHAIPSLSNDPIIHGLVGIIHSHVTKATIALTNTTQQAQARDARLRKAVISEIGEKLEEAYQAGKIPIAIEDIELVYEAIIQFKQGGE